MKIGLFAPLTNPHHTPDYLRALGQAGETRGFHSLWLGEHVVLFEDYASSYPYSPDGKIRIAGDAGMIEPFTALAFLAAETEKLRLGTGICLVPQRNPVYTAKEAAAVDYLSNGRFDFGVGVGWLEEEFRALGVPFARRGARCDEYLQVIKSLWCDSVSEFEGEFYSLPPCRQYPKPIQAPHPPIHFGGESEAALRRVANFGQGWYGFNLTPAATAERVRRLAQLLEERDRALNDIEITVCPYLNPVDPDAVERYHEAGVDQLVVMVFTRTIEKMEAQLDGFVESALRRAAAL